MKINRTWEYPKYTKMFSIIYVPNHLCSQPFMFLTIYILKTKIKKTMSDFLSKSICSYSPSEVKILIKNGILRVSTVAYWLNLHLSKYQYLTWAFFSDFAALLPIQFPGYNLGKEWRMAPSLGTLHPSGRLLGKLAQLEQLDHLGSQSMDGSFVYFFSLSVIFFVNLICLSNQNKYIFKKNTHLLRKQEKITHLNHT